MRECAVVESEAQLPLFEKTIAVSLFGFNLKRTQSAKRLNETFIKKKEKNVVSLYLRNLYDLAEHSRKGILDIASLKRIEQCRNAKRKRLEYIIQRHKARRLRKEQRRLQQACARFWLACQGGVYENGTLHAGTRGFQP